MQATAFGPKCPQSPPSVPTAKFSLGDEDCLFLNVYAPAATRGKTLPVMIWIHPGGYGLNDGTQDMTELINANNNTFVVVAIQHRVTHFSSTRRTPSRCRVSTALLTEPFCMFSWERLASFRLPKSRARALSTRASLTRRLLLTGCRIISTNLAETGRG